MTEENPMARTIAQKRFKGKHNPIIEKFLFYLEEDPEVDIQEITEKRVDWHFTPDSKVVKEIAGDIVSIADLTDEQRSLYDKAREQYEYELGVRVKKEMGTMGVLKAIMGK